MRKVFIDNEGQSHEMEFQFIPAYPNGYYKVILIGNANYPDPIFYERREEGKLRIPECRRKDVELFGSIAIVLLEHELDNGIIS